MDVAVLGMGRMGRAIAGRLLGGGHRVRVWNRTPGRAGEVLAAGGREALTIAEAVAGADVVVTMLSDDAAVTAVALGEIRPVIGDATVYVDCSTVSPECGSALAAAFSGRFAAMPLIGSPAAVTGGHAILLAGGPSTALDRLAPVMTSLAGSIRRYDSPSLALTAKLTTNLMLLSEVVALAESFAVGRAGGLRDDELRELLGASPVLPPGVRSRFEDVLTGPQDTWWSTALGAKDAGLALAVARRADVDLPAAEAVHDRYEQAASSGLRDADIAAVATLYR
ncbi:NAD(P)-dependent oxidoreductase [Dactylosporangium sp. NPDC005572]|uniref:NAD(P)-dependent oxidoreductase n=1 Tax=Dactylosporangium sp. NPDC005572 TaxID=3156889 RepID=UPI0033B327BA